MRKLLYFIICAASFLMAVVFSNILLGIVFPNSLLGIGSFVSYAIGFFVARFVWMRLQTTGAGGAEGPFVCIATGAIMLGAIGFTGGFFGPMMFAPEANQGPLLGIFYTGPIGFLLGGVAGFVWWLVKRRA
ncbi:hypothetical protein GC177_02565 [bacterium]|nr:hypothetical protein [bacterium]